MLPAIPKELLGSGPLRADDPPWEGPEARLELPEPESMIRSAWRWAELTTIPPTTTPSRIDNANGAARSSPRARRAGGGRHVEPSYALGVQGTCCPVTVIGTLKAFPSHAAVAPDERSRTALTCTAEEVSLAGTVRLKPDVGALESTVITELGQAVGSADDGVSHAMFVISTAYGFGLVTVNYTLPAGPPG